MKKVVTREDFVYAKDVNQFILEVNKKLDEALNQGENFLGFEHDPNEPVGSVRLEFGHVVTT